jgi:hypothetical protein
MPVEKCGLCGEEVPYDDAGMGGTLLMAHAAEHEKEMNELGMTIEEYKEHLKCLF